MPQLFVLSGPDVGKSFELSNGDSIGRSPDCVITLRDASVSRRHGHVERNGPQWFIVDDGSRNGISFNGAKQKRVELADMQELSIGEILLRFRASAPASRASEPKVDPTAPPRITAPAQDDELVLEGGDDEIELDLKEEPPPRVRPPPPTPARAAAPEAAETSFAPRAAPPQMRASMLDTGFGPRPAGAGDTLSRRAPGAGDRVLQYHKLANTRGVAGTDLAQLSLWMRWGAYVLVFLVAVAIAYFAFFGTASLKSKLGGDANDEAAEETQR